MVVVDVTVNFLDDSFHEFPGIWLTKQLVQVHNVSHHFCEKCNGMMHAILKVKMAVQVIVVMLTHGL